jgi:3-keto-disaccharide hydrolase
MNSLIPFVFALLVTVSQSAPARPALIGRWDLTVHTASGDRASWLEVRHSGVKTLVGQFVGSSGSARPISNVEFKDGALRFAIPPQWDRVDGDLVVSGRLDGDRLSGTMTLANGEPTQWTGVRAPALQRSSPPRWGAPVPLIAKGGLDGWHILGGSNEWEVADGVLRNKKGGGNLVTDRMFDDFKLHVEFRYPKDSNSGMYLRGRYEVQIVDLPDDQMAVDALGAIYGFLAPNQAAARKPDEWQTFDVTLAGRLVTVALNGKTIICDAEIPGITGGALDSREGDPGPVLLQGDHGPVEFRNMTIAPAVR